MARFCRRDENDLSPLRRTGLPSSTVSNTPQPCAVSGASTGTRQSARYASFHLPINSLPRQPSIVPTLPTNSMSTVPDSLHHRLLRPPSYPPRHNPLRLHAALPRLRRLGRHARQQHARPPAPPQHHRRRVYSRHAQILPLAGFRYNVRGFRDLGVQAARDWGWEDGESAGGAMGGIQFLVLHGMGGGRDAANAVR